MSQFLLLSFAPIVKKVNCPDKFHSSLREKQNEWLYLESFPSTCVTSKFAATIIMDGE